ncbi:MAG: hypothetical protein KDD63_26425, partial [Bacteroidetes bacterium]|nr:hypothetical protein [Bacteroidota bacterium]
MNKPPIITNIEQLLKITIHPAPIRGDDLIGGLMPYKKNTPKYAINGDHLIGLNLANTGLTDEKWQAILALPDFKPLEIKALNLSDNSITEFRDEWGFDNLTHLNLDDNKLTYPPEEITVKGNAAILNYLKELQEGDVVVYEAKLLIIGEAGAGKTTLARKLGDPNAPMPKDKDTTKGIEVNPLLMQEKGEADFTMHIWDFGGQEIYHSTHQFFLSKRSLYILILDGRVEEDPHYWLQVQDLLGEKSPVLLLLNKKAGIRQQVAFQELLGLYPNLQKHFQPFSLKEDRNQIQEFTRVVEQQIRNLPHFKRNEKVPRKWADIRNRLKELSQAKNYISLEKFREICAEKGISEEDRQDFLSDFLHSLGIILHFSKVPLLNRIVILRPDWATNAVYKVLDHTRAFANILGHFHRDELDTIWADGNYKGVFDEMLTLMQKFELCYALPDKPDEYIVPQLLSPDKPVYAWKDKNQLKLHYTYTFMPKGIVTRLIVRLHRYIKDQETVWQRGAVFEYEGARAEVNELYRDKTIHIKTQGSNRKALMAIITHQIDEINSTFGFDDRLKVNQLIPCNCPQCKKSEAPYFFLKDVLYKAKGKGVTYLQCQNSFEDVSVLGLIDDVFTQNMVEASIGKMKESPRHENHYHFHDKVGSVNTDNKGAIHTNTDQRNIITRAEDLIDVSDKVKESSDLTPGQKRRWKRWMGN